MDNDKTELIRQLNDDFRRSGLGGDILITPGIQNLGDEATQAIAGKVMQFDAFNADNDPYGQHDFGAFDHAGEKIFWKIDYYGPELTFGSEDPSDPRVTRRILTIFLASEY